MKKQHRATHTLASILRKNFPNNTIMFVTDDVTFEIYKPKKEI